MAMRALRRLFSPALGVDHSEPVLAWLLRRMPWLQSERARAAALIFFFIGFTASTVIFLALGRSLPAADVWVMLVFVGVRLLLDGLAAASAWGRLGPEYRSGRWDLLRLTAQTEGALLRAHYAAAHAGVWRMAMFGLGVQSGAALAFVTIWFATRSNYPLQFPVWAFALMLLAGWELLLRPRTLVAVGLALSATAPRAGVAALLGGAALMLFWVANLAVLIVSSLAATTVLGLITLPWQVAQSDAFVALILAFSLALFGVVFGSLMILDVFVQRAALFRLASAVANRDAAV